MTGSPDQYPNAQKITVEGVTAVNASTSSTTPFLSGTVTVNVTDGRLTLGSDYNGSANTRLDYVDITANAAPGGGFQTGVAFGPDGSAAVPGYRTDLGNGYRPQSNGYTFGWVDPATGAAASNSGNWFARTLPAGSDPRLARGVTSAGKSWEMKVPNGTYYVTLVAGDADVSSGTYGYGVENVAGFLSGTATSSNHWITASGPVVVTDNKLTIFNTSGVTNHALAYVNITDYAAHNRSTVVAPIAVVATASAGNTVDVRWTDHSDNDTGFKVERLNASGTPTLLGTTYANAGVLTDTTASPNTTYTYRVTALNGTFASTSVVSNAITTPGAAAGQVPYNVTRVPWTTDATIQAEDFDAGGAGVAFDDSTAGNAGGYYRAGDADVGYNVADDHYFLGWNKAGEWVEYTINVPTAGTYQFQTSVASEGTGGTFSVSLNDPSHPKVVGLGVPNTGSFTAYQTIASGTFTLAAGNNQVLRLASTANDPTHYWVGDIDWIKLVKVGDAPSTTVTVTGTPATSFTPSAAVGGVPPSLELTGTIRDFHPNGANGQYSDFQQYDIGSYPGIVEPELGTDRTPTLTPNWVEGRADIRDATSFHQWFHDTPGYNETTSLAMPFTLKSDDGGTPIYQFDNQVFLPINGRLFGNENGGVNGNFTMELHSSFTYHANAANPPVLNFIGDDDVWVFINNKLALDLGGIHGAMSGSITLDAATATTLGMADGNTYAFDFFYAERQIGTSTLHLETSLPIFGDYDYRATLTATDSDPSQALTWTIDQPTTGATITAGTGSSPLTSQLAWTPGPGDYGTTKHFNVHATDADGNVSNYKEWDVVVGAGANHVPHAVGSTPITPSTTPQAGQAWTFDAAAGFADADGDALSFLAGGQTPLPDGMTLDADGTFHWTPKVSQTGAQHVAYTVSDGRGGYVDGAFDVTVAAAPPVSISVSPSTIHEHGAGTATYTVTLDDALGLRTPITVPIWNYNSTAGPAEYLVDHAVGKALPTSVTFAPPAGGYASATQTVTFSVTAVDDATPDGDERIDLELGNGEGFTAGASAHAQLDIVDDGTGGGTGTPTNHPPQPVPTAPQPPTTATVGVQYRWDFSQDFTDPDGDTLHYLSLAAPPGDAALDPTTGVFTWTPTTSDVGATQIAFVVDDGHGGTLPWLFNVAVANASPTIPGTIGDMDIYEDSDNDGYHDNSTSGEDAEALTATLIPDTAAADTAHLVVFVGSLDDSSTVTFVFSTDDLQLYRDEYATSPISSGEAITLADLVRDDRGFTSVYAIGASDTDVSSFAVGTTSQASTQRTSHGGIRTIVKPPVGDPTQSNNFPGGIHGSDNYGPAAPDDSSYRDGNPYDDAGAPITGGGGLDDGDGTQEFTQRDGFWSTPRGDTLMIGFAGHTQSEGFDDIKGPIWNISETTYAKRQTGIISIAERIHSMTGYATTLFPEDPGSSAKLSIDNCGDGVFGVSNPLRGGARVDALGNGTGALAFLTDAVMNHGIKNVGLFGYSHGGGCVNLLMDAIGYEAGRDPAFQAAFKGVDGIGGVNFFWSAYIDAVHIIFEPNGGVFNGTGTPFAEDKAPVADTDSVGGSDPIRTKQLISIFQSPIRPNLFLRDGVPVSGDFFDSSSTDLVQHVHEISADNPGSSWKSTGYLDHVDVFDRHGVPHGIAEDNLVQSDLIDNLLTAIGRYN